jgi:hypothetical protein
LHALLFRQRGYNRWRRRGEGWEGVMGDILCSFIDRNGVAA